MLATTTRQQPTTTAIVNTWCQPVARDAPACGLFFSGYAEGTSNNKFLEIYNLTDAAISLDGYAYPSVANAPTTPGEYEYWNDFDAGASIAPDVYVIAHGSADPAILAEADETHNFLSNGDDGYMLVMGTEDDYIQVDAIGDWNGDPGSGWDVAGVLPVRRITVRSVSLTSPTETVATGRHLLVRTLTTVSGLSSIKMIGRVLEATTSPVLAVAATTPLSTTVTTCA